MKHKWRECQPYLPKCDWVYVQCERCLQCYPKSRARRINGKDRQWVQACFDPCEAALVRAVATRLVGQKPIHLEYVFQDDHWTERPSSHRKIQ